MTAIEQAIADDVIMSPEEVAAREARLEKFGRTLADVAPLVPEEQDPTVLFRNNWLGRGQVVQLTATSGVGKSSMTMQTAFNWAAGRTFLAEPMRPLKCAIIQAEDSERDVAEQIAGMRRGLVEIDGWDADEVERVAKEILCPTCFIGKMGESFIALLREFQGDMKCDMLFINPVQAFFGGDISDQEAVSRWTRGGIDPIIKDEGMACGAFLVTHTAKIVSGQKEGRANVDDYGEYIGAGSHEWTDWTRAKFTFLKKGKNETYFAFKAAKRGRRLGWEDESGEVTTNKVFKHTDGYIYWQEVKDAEEIAEAEGKAPSAESVEDTAGKIAADLKANGAAKISDFDRSERFKRLGSRPQIRAAKAMLLAHPEKWRLTITDKLIGRRWTKFVGLVDGIEAAAKSEGQREATAATREQAEDGGDIYNDIFNKIM